MSLYYFDHAASAPRREEVFAAMAPYLQGVVGNPSGTHRAARSARRAIEEARDEIAAFLDVAPGGVILTAGGTESCHLALTGVTKRFRREHGAAEIIVSPVEHHAVLESAKDLAAQYDDVTVHFVPVDADGVVDLEALGHLLGPRTAIVSVMTANNETGVCQPVNAVGDAVRSLAPGAASHSDAVAAAPWLNLVHETSNLDLISICAHKLGGPVNAGALAMRSTLNLDAVVSGGGQERGRRGGTVDVAAAVGLAAAVRATARERDSAVRATSQRQRRLEKFMTSIPGVQITAPNATRLPGHVHLTVEGVSSDEMLFLLDQAGVCASAASSCSSGAVIASHVLAAMGVPAARARGALRFTMGAETTDDDVVVLENVFAETVRRLRAEE